MSPAWQADRNVGKCSFHTCRAVSVPRCDGFMCAGCCTIYHANWTSHRRGDGTLSGPGTSGKNGHSQVCVCIACRRDREAKPTVPVEWDYDAHPPEFGETAELGEDHERCFIPLSNWKANKDWPADYIG